MKVLTCQTTPVEANGLGSAIQIVLASCFIGISAQVSIPLYFTPIPLTGQTFGVLLVGALLGSRKGALAAFFYLIQGIFGLPVVAGGKFVDVHYFLGITGGYLFAFILGAYLVGKFLEGRDGLTVGKITLLCFLASAIQMGIGALWFSSFVGITSAFVLGFLPFIFGEFMKCWAVALIHKKSRNA